MLAGTIQTVQKWYGRLHWEEITPEYTLERTGVMELVHMLGLFVGHMDFTSISLSVFVHKMGMIISELMKGQSERIYVEEPTTYLAFNNLQHFVFKLGHSEADGTESQVEEHGYSSQRIYAQHPIRASYKLRDLRHPTQPACVQATGLLGRKCYGSVCRLFSTGPGAS